MIRSMFLFLNCLLLIAFKLIAQDTLTVTLQQADSIFLKNNLFLLSQQYNIDAAKALIIQARAYPNPVFSADLNMLDPQNNEVFHVNNSGQKAFGIQQLIVMGGKRKAEIDIAKENSVIAEIEFSELLRNLQMQLHGSFFNLYQQRSVIAQYDYQLKELDTLIAAYEVQVQKNNLPLKDVIRLKSAYLKINDDKSALSAIHVEEIKKVQTLLQSAVYVIPDFKNEAFDQYNVLKQYKELLDSANLNRPDLKIANEETALAMLNLSLQKKMVIPDITLSSFYDQRGGAFHNQVNAGLSVPLPIWDRNRGNIKAAEAVGKSAALYQQQKHFEVEAEVQAAWQNMLRSISEYNKIKELYSNEFDLVFEGISSNFQKRNITILEFVDFLEAYNESLSSVARVKTQLAISAGFINYVTATKVY